MSINPRIVFTFTLQRWSSTTFSSYLTLLVWRYTLYLIHLLLSSCNCGDWWPSSSKHAAWGTWIFFIPPSSPSSPFGKKNFFKCKLLPNSIETTLHMKHPLLFKYFFNLQSYDTSKILQNVLNNVQRIIMCPDQDDLRKKVKISWHCPLIHEP